MIFFFFLGSLPEKLPEVAELGGWWRWTAAGNGCWWLEMAGGSCWTQTIGLETCIESLIG
jgi:hypothetical protein